MGEYVPDVFRDEKCADIMAASDFDRPLAAWSKYRTGPMPIIALPYDEWVVIDHDGGRPMPGDLPGLVASVVTDRGWQAILTPPTSQAAWGKINEYQDKTYEGCSFERKAWTLRTRSRDGQEPRVLHVVNWLTAVEIAAAWVEHDSPVVSVSS